MENIQEYLERFRHLFSLPAGTDSRVLYQKGWSWVRMYCNQFGLLRLQRGEKYEGTISELMWYKDELVAIEGLDFNLAPLLYIAERLGLPTDDPLLNPIRQTDEYRKVVETGQIDLDS